jgi:hypothetical protein
MAMRTASCLTLLAIGAIFTFAVSKSPSFLNLQIAGVVIMATGAAGLFLRKPAQGWLRRRTVLRGARGRVVGQVDETRYPPYVMLNPGADPDEPHGRQPGDATAAAAVDPGSETTPDLPLDDVADDSVKSGWPADAKASEEFVEEYIEE